LDAKESWVFGLTDESLRFRTSQKTERTEIGRWAKAVVSHEGAERKQPGGGGGRDLRKEGDGGAASDSERN